MSNIVTYNVLREHEGDRFYKTGETRDLDSAEAKHLADLGVLVKAEKPHENKAERASPKNK